METSLNMFFFFFFYVGKHEESTGKNASNVVHMDICDTLELYDLHYDGVHSDVDFDNDFPKFHRPMGFWFHGNNSPESMAFFSRTS